MIGATDTETDSVTDWDSHSYMILITDGLSHLLSH